MLSTALEVITGLSQATARDRPAGRDAERLLQAIQDLSCLRELDGVMRVVRVAARQLSGADGVTFVLADGDLVHYADEDAIGPLWKGRRFPASACISGWAMIHRQTVVIEDIYADPRIPADAYRPTFVKSLAMVPIRREAPLGAVGAYWARPHRATEREVGLLEALAGATATALANAQLYDAARRATRSRDEFLTVVAHELRTPLTPLKLHVDALGRALERQQAPGETKEAVARIAAQVDRMSGVVSGLLEVARMGAEVPEVERTTFDLAALAREVADRFAPVRAGAWPALTVRAPGAVVGRWDRGRVAQAVSSLVANAVKFGDGKPVEVNVEDRGGRALLQVRDQGIGIAEEDHARIFERFERAVSTRNFGGFGLGLWIARLAVEAHDGTISVASRPGEGATFTVVLPK